MYLGVGRARTRKEYVRGAREKWIWAQVTEEASLAQGGGAVAYAME